MQSLKNKSLELDLFLQSLKNQPAIVCITEHWYTSDEKLCMHLDAYNVVSVWSRENVKNGG